MSKSYSVLIERTTNRLAELDSEFAALSAAFDDLNKVNSDMIAEFESVLASKCDPFQQNGNEQTSKILEAQRTTAELTDQLGAQSVKTRSLVRDVEFRRDKWATLTYLRELAAGQTEKAEFARDFAKTMMTKARRDRISLTQHCFEAAADAAEKLHRKFLIRPLYAEHFCQLSINQEEVALNNRRILELENILISMNDMTQAELNHADRAQKRILEVQHQNKELVTSVEALRSQLSQLKQFISDKDIGFIDLRYRTGATLRSIEKLTKSAARQEKMLEQQKLTVRKMEERIANTVRIVDEIAVDVRLQNQLNANIEIVCRIQRREFSLKCQDRTRLHQEVSRWQDELNAKRICFDEQTEIIENIKQTLTEGVARERFVRRKSSNFKVLKLAEIRLSAQLSRAQSLARKLAYEVRRPRLVHQSQIYEFLDCSYSKQLRRIEFLRFEVEGLRQEELRLFAVRDALQNGVYHHYSKVQRITLMGHESVLETARRILSDKESELQQLEFEFLTAANDAREMELTVKALQNLIKQAASRSSMRRTAKDELKVPSVVFKPLQTDGPPQKPKQAREPAEQKTRFARRSPRNRPKKGEAVPHPPTEPKRYRAPRGDPSSHLKRHWNEEMYVHGRMLICLYWTSTIDILRNRVLVEPQRKCLSSMLKPKGRSF
jgi:hypothetical protein